MAIAMVLAVAVQGGDGAAVVPASVLVAVARTIHVSYHLRGPTMRGSESRPSRTRLNLPTLRCGSTAGPYPSGPSPGSLWHL